MREAGAHSGVSYLRAYDHWDHLQLQERSPDTPLFPRVSGGTVASIDWSVRVNKQDWVQSWLRPLLLQAGYNPTLYSGHSFRSGGATDLFAVGVPPRLIQGRWKSDAFWLYVRDNPELRCASIAAAFEEVARQLNNDPQPQTDWGI